jgi:ABC-type multidrug transport system fused ATPase/permease subunit
MNVQLHQIFGLLDRRERQRLTWVVALIAFGALFEIAGVSIIFPFMSAIAAPESLSTSRWFMAIGRWLNLSSETELFIVLGAITFAVVLAGILAAAAVTWVQLRFSLSLGHRLSVRVLQTYLGSPYSFFLERNPTTLGMSAVDEVSRLVSFVVLPALQLVGRCLIIALLLGVIWLADPVLASIVGLTIASIYALIYLAVRRKLRRLGHVSAESNRLRYKFVQEAISGIKRKILRRERFFIARFEQASHAYSSSQARSGLISALPRYALEAAGFGGAIAAILYLLTTGGQIGAALPVIALYAVAGFRLMPAVQQVFSSLAQMRFGLAHISQLLGDLGTRVPSDSSSQMSSNAETRVASFVRMIQLQNVSFLYPSANEPSLVDVSFQIPKNLTVGFVGPSGSGKTTAIEIIIGLLQPSRGQLLIDGAPLDDEARRAWQRRVGYVPQSIYLIDDTVTRNIAFGIADEEIDQRRVEVAARMANAHDFIVEVLPAGYDTRVGDRGVRLSGGQRQRIAIARALYDDPDLLILDEATSALDTTNEDAILEAIRTLAHRKTIIIVAHRFTTIQNCDVVFLFERGRLADSGGYDELMTTSLTFRQLAKVAPGGQAAEPSSEVRSLLPR